jgi:PAS domain S-box-containing protein
MKLNLGQLSVKSRFFLFTAGTVLFWLLSGFCVYSLIDSIPRLQKTDNAIQSLPVVILEMENAIADFYITDLQMDEFHELGTSEGIQNFNDSYLEANNQLRELQADPVILKNPPIHQKTGLLLEYLSEADQTFQTIVSKYRQRGRDQYGISGDLYDIMDDQDSGPSTFDSELLRSLESELKDYLEYPQENSITSIENLLENLTQSFNDEELVQRFLFAAGNLLIIDRELGFSPYEGLRNQLSRSFRILNEETIELKDSFALEKEKKIKRLNIIIALIVILSVVIYTSGILLINRSVMKPVEHLYEFTRELAEGKFPSSSYKVEGDEFGSILGLLNNFVQSLRDKARFTADLADGKEHEKLNLLGDEDQLGNSLIQMGKHIKAAKLEDQKYKQSRDERRWSSEGVAKFGEILRMHNNEINALAENVIQELVGYLNASAGGFFLLSSEDEEVSLNLISSFAFDRKKYLKKQFSLGEGLVGTCALEKEKIVLTDIPEDYINISSGLGESRPRSLILIPLKFEDQILGIIEIASISQFKDFEIEFVESLAESIASAVSSVQMNMRTAELLKQSQEQAREMAKQEEIMRQQMEELQTTQEESSRRESEISGILNAIHNSSLVAEYNMHEELININDRFIVLLETQRTQIMGRKHHEIVGISRHTDSYKNLWEEIRDGKTITQVEKISVPAGQDIWLRQTFTPILDKDGEPFKVLSIASDITETIEQQKSLEAQAGEITRANIEMRTFSDAVDSALIKCVYSPAGQILEVNENYENATGYTEKELVGKNNRVFLQRVEKEQFEKIWEDIRKEKPYKGVIRRTKPTGEEVWIMSTFTPVKDENGNIFKVFYLGQNITEKKLKYQLLEEANKEIERLRKQLDEKK